MAVVPCVGGGKGWSGTLPQRDEPELQISFLQWRHDSWRNCANLRIVTPSEIPNGLSTAAVVNIVIAAVVFLSLVVVVCYCCVCKGRCCGAGEGEGEGEGGSGSGDAAASAASENGGGEPVAQTGSNRGAEMATLRARSRSSRSDSQDTSGNGDRGSGDGGAGGGPRRDGMVPVSDSSSFSSGDLVDQRAGGGGR